MALDGTYNIELQSPMGKRNGKLTLKTDGTSLSGTYAGERGEQSFDNGTVEGNECAWAINMSGPMGQIQLNFTGVVNGDAISGNVQLGSFGSATFSGIRA